MIGIIIDFKVSELEEEFNNEGPFALLEAYNEIEKILQYYEAKRVTDDFYTISCCDNVLTTVYKLVEELKSIKWIKKCISNFKIFKIKDYSDFTVLVKNEE